MTLSNIAKTIATLANKTKIVLISFLLKEDGYFLLLETGDKIILEETSGIMSNLTKTSA